MNRRPVPRLIAFYLTQFHPIPENDAWWGKGFTEWTNVTKATPLFDGHYQPRLPSDLGFYDLRLREARHQQIKLAKEYGIDGFCYHYYWFSGQRLLEKPLDDMLADQHSDMPFCLCWANENWTRRWDAAEHEILIAQRYQPEDDLAFIKSLVPYFSDPRYIRVEGRPFLIVYRPQHLPKPQQTLETWREHCRHVGLGEIHLSAALTHGNQQYRNFGFDSGVEFPPHNKDCSNVTQNVPFKAPFRGFVGEYEEIAHAFLKRDYRGDNVFKTVFPSWDNTPRTGDRGLVVLNGSPNNYEFWLSETIRHTQAAFPGKDRLVFINAWNEWAEGCHLEPDLRYQRQYLEATRRAKSGECRSRGFSSGGVQDPAGPVRTVLGDMRSVLTYHSYLTVGRLVAILKRYPRVRNAVRWLVSLRPRFVDR